MKRAGGAGHQVLGLESDVHGVLYAIGLPGLAFWTEACMPGQRVSPKHAHGRLGHMIFGSETNAGGNSNHDIDDVNDKRGHESLL